MDDLKGGDSLDPNAAESLDSGESTQEKQDREAGLLLHEFLKKYPARSFVSLSIADKPKLVKEKKDTLRLELDLAFNTERYFNQFLPESKNIFKQIARESKRGYYRNPHAIEAIRKIPAEGIRVTDSVFSNAAAGNGFDVIIPDRKNTFSYTAYSLAEETLNAYSERSDADAMDSRKLEYVVKFLDGNGEEVFEYSDAVQYRAFMQEEIPGRGSALSETEIMEREILYLPPKGSVTLHVNAPDMRSVDWVKRNVSEEYLALNVVEKFTGVVKALRVEFGTNETGWLYAADIKTSYNKNELAFSNSPSTLSFHPSLITDADVECEKNRFSIEFIMPEELLPEVQSLKIEVLQ